MAEEKNELKKDKAIALLKGKYPDYFRKAGKTITYASKNKTADTYWATPRPDFLKRDWILILNDFVQGQLHLFFIEANAIDADKIKKRNFGNLGELLDIQIEYKSKEYKDKASGYCFLPHHVGFVEYEIAPAELEEKPKAQEFERNHLNVILYGPPGTGKTYNTVFKALDLMGESYGDYDEAIEKYDELRKAQHDAADPDNPKEPRIQFVTFHQSYGYEEFIEGIRPRTENGVVAYNTEPGVFKRFCDAARADKERKYVFIIDEINRGNISKIFGELITLIEENKRDGEDEAASAILPYSGESFSVPSNVYILGTMNTADRSITSIDTALRRRFYFEEMLPNSELLAGIWVEGIDVKRMFEKMNERIELLYDREHCIGHAYMMGLKDDSTMDNLADIFKTRIIPLLQEYFYDDYEKIRCVLGDNLTNDASRQFITEESKDLEKIFGSDMDGIRSIYSVNEKALTNPDAYKKIYDAGQAK